MSLMKRRTMTERQKAASRENGRRSHGVATLEGREQIRAANLRHGLFSQAREIVLPTLGEDAAEFARLRQGCCEQWPGADPSEIESLAAAMWRMERAELRVEQLYPRFVRTLFEPTDNQPDPYTRALTVEACAFRDVMRISNRLLRADDARRAGALTGLPENSLRTKEGE
jgi:hypothetical protein